MGKKTKIGKQRKDKYYQLAKESGFRSRAAFKLIQLNRKFEFLQKSRVCIDLCAAPGGWMQVARQNMPVSSIVLGIDLFPIKPIPGCISLTEDITTEKCRVNLTKELQTWKADVILHDGAPNVGRNWLHDAYQQACLTLSALKLATQFLRPGGWFITKVFRSKDYQPLIWVFKQLFKRVHATKPQASRNESAEIFVVCQYYIAPNKIDPKFMDPKHVFEDLEIEPGNKLNVFHPEKTKKGKAEGYPENDATLYHTVSVLDFVKHENAIDILQTASAIIFDDEAIKSHEKTTKEIIECCKDIKVLGRKDLRQIISWWKVLHEDYMKTNQSEEPVEELKDNVEKDKDEDSDDDDKEITKQISELEHEEQRELKRKRKQTQKARAKLNERLNLKMVIKGDDGPTVEGEDLFSLKLINSYQDMGKIMEQHPETLAESDDDEDDRLREKYERYSKGEGKLDSSGTYYRDGSDEELEMESGEEDEEDVNTKGLGLTDSESEEETLGPVSRKKSKKDLDGEEHPLITDLDYRDKDQKRNQKARLWFERDAFKNLLGEEDEDADLDKLAAEYRKKGANVIEQDQTEVSSKLDKKLTKKDKLKPQKKNEETELDKTSDDDADDSDTTTDSDEDSDYNVEEIEEIKRNGKLKQRKDNKDGFEVVKSSTTPGFKGKRKLTEEELALGTVMVNSKKSKRDLIDAAWNRYTFNDTNLPDWFVDDEKKHMTKEAPVPKEMVDEYKKRLEELNVRPIKKVIEAKARKKKRAFKKLDKAKKKVEALIDNDDVTDREKAKQVKALYRKAHAEPKREVTYVVAKKYNAGKKAARPAGVKGQYKIVDPRMKKDMRAQKKKMKTMGRGKKGGGMGGKMGGKAGGGGGGKSKGRGGKGKR